MRIPRIYTASNLHQADNVILETKALKHIKDVLRMNAGDCVSLFNGDGYNYAGTIKELSKKSICIELTDKHKADNESPLYLHLLQPLCRSDKMDWCLQKATELGANEITPYTSTRVNINIPKDRLNKKMIHWNSVAQSASEQSGRASIPIINPPLAFHDLISSTNNQEGIKIIASPSSAKIFAEIAQQEYQLCICAIGPEGGFNDKEIRHAESHDFIVVQFGPRVLRLETAVISAMTICQSSWGDLS